MLRPFLTRSLVAAMLVVAVAERVAAQHSHRQSDTTANSSHGSHDMTDMGTGGANEDWKMTAMAKHMAYSKTRPLTPGDSSRAAQIINELRQAIAKYQDVRVAEADGYKMFAPEIKNQPQYHFTKGWNAMRNQFGFDPARPTALLYKKNAQGELELIGAMYTAKKGT